MNIAEGFCASTTSAVFVNLNGLAPASSVLPTKCDLVTLSPAYTPEPVLRCPSAPRLPRRVLACKTALLRRARRSVHHPSSSPQKCPSSFSAATLRDYTVYYDSHDEDSDYTNNDPDVHGFRHNTQEEENALSCSTAARDSSEEEASGAASCMANASHDQARMLASNMQLDSTDSSDSSHFKHASGVYASEAGNCALAQLSKSSCAASHPMTC